MKKRLEAELISIAHRILKLKNKSEVDQLYKETQKLYETLSVLKFYQDNFESVKSEVSEEDLEQKLGVEEPETQKAEEKPELEENIPAQEEQETAEPKGEEAEIQAEAEATAEEATAEEPAVEEEHPGSDVLQPESIEEVAAVVSPEIVKEEKPAFEPIFQLEEEEEQPVATEEKVQEKLEDMIGKYADPVFVKPDDASLFTRPAATQPEDTAAKEEPRKEETQSEQPKPVSVNDVLSKSIAIGLNDRIGFVQHLFNGSNEDFNRVLSQLNTFDTFEEAKTFINEMVIPDYNYWVGEEEYIERFMDIVEKKFS